ncbi:MAG: D-mannonate dehydratase [Enterocloster citroniae]|nr:D-mannonate dehydratase [Enterocloster citroniae]
MNQALHYQEPEGIKISAMVQPDVQEGYLRFLEQMGVRFCYTWAEGEQAGYGFLKALKERLAAHGMTLYNVGDMSLGKSESILLGLSDRDRVLERFKGFIRTLGKLGIHTTTVTWEPSNTLSTAMDGTVVSDRLGGRHDCGRTRGRATARMVDEQAVRRAGLSHGREYSKDEIWDNFTYFVRQIMPAAEEAGVRIALHPNDPPMDRCLGISTLIQSSKDYERAFAIADSPFLGMEFCVGCWLEGGEGFGPLLSDIGRFAKEGRVFIVHFRNVSSPLPRFTETFIDDGYQDMYQVMKAFVEAGYNGTLTMDHTPGMDPLAGPAGETAFAVGYLKALYQAARDEVYHLI